MAEMASMAPIAGAQYHWVSEFAPERYQKILSYLTGYIPTPDQEEDFVANTSQVDFNDRMAGR